MTFHPSPGLEIGPVSDVNSTDIRAAIALGCRPMQCCFDADHDHVPLFYSRLWPKADLRFDEWGSDAHIPGRHLSALLHAEAVIGVPIEKQALAHHTAAAIRSYSGAVMLPLNCCEIGGPPVNFNPHNVREGFQALHALLRYRGSQQAAELARQSIRTILQLWDPARGWDGGHFADLGIHFRPSHSFVQGLARAIGPLVKLYRAGIEPALELAMMLKEKLVRGFFLEEGRYDPERCFTHVHSVTCVLSSLAQLAELLVDGALMKRVEAFYDNGLWELRDQLGWSMEVFGQEHSDHGETNNTGDILETALILGRWGRIDGLHDAERILRGHLLPSQLRDVSFVTDPPNPDRLDRLHDLADRHLGAWGMPAPYGHLSAGRGREGGLCFNLDMVGGVVDSLCAAYEQVTSHEEGGHHVNLLFDHETEAICVESPYTHDALRVHLKKPGPLWVRMPPWLAPEDVTFEGTDAAPAWTNGGIVLADPPLDRPLTIRFPLKVQQLTVSQKVHIHPIRVSLKGDQVTAMDHFGMPLTFFPPFP